jgi:hypothetical protein
MSADNHMRVGDRTAGLPHLSPPFYEQAKAKGWKTLTRSCGHDVMLDQPEELAEELLVFSR